MSSQTHLLAANALIQISFSAVFGAWLLHRVHVRGSRSGVHDLVAAHVDWIMLALVEVALSYAMTLFEKNDIGASALLVLIGGWLNPVPYLARGLGVNAFALRERWCSGRWRP